MAKNKAVHVDKVIVEQGCGNVFADLGLPNAELHLLKADLVSRIDQIVRRIARSVAGLHSRSMVDSAFSREDQ